MAFIYPAGGALQRVDSVEAIAAAWPQPDVRVWVDVEAADEQELLALRDVFRLQRRVAPGLRRGGAMAADRRVRRAHLPGALRALRPEGGGRGRPAQARRLLRPALPDHRPQPAAVDRPAGQGPVRPAPGIGHRPGRRLHALRDHRRDGRQLPARGRALRGATRRPGRPVVQPGGRRPAPPGAGRPPARPAGTAPAGHLATRPAAAPDAGRVRLRLRARSASSSTTSATTSPRSSTRSTASGSCSAASTRPTTRRSPTAPTRP